MFLPCASVFLIPIERATGDSQMIFVLGKHTPFAAGAKRCDTAKTLVSSRRKSRWNRAPRVVGSALIGSAFAQSSTRDAASSAISLSNNAQAHLCDRRFGVRSAGHLRAAAAGWHNPYTLGG
jgi:hypothetical protein